MNNNIKFFFFFFFIPESSVYLKFVLSQAFVVYAQKVHICHFSILNSQKGRSLIVVVIVIGIKVQYLILVKDCFF